MRAEDEPQSERARTQTTRDFLRELAERLDGVPVDPTAPRGTCPTHLRRLALEGAETDGLPLDKISRWMGFIHGVMTMRAMLDVDEERDHTRAPFHAAYEADGIRKPPTIDVSQRASPEVQET